MFHQSFPKGDGVDAIVDTSSQVNFCMELDLWFSKNDGPKRGVLKADVIGKDRSLKTAFSLDLSTVKVSLLLKLGSSEISSTTDSSAYKVGLTLKSSWVKESRLLDLGSVEASLLLKLGSSELSSTTDSSASKVGLTLKSSLFKESRLLDLGSVEASVMIF
jgi:hypothetical protein